MLGGLFGKKKLLSSEDKERILSEVLKKVESGHSMLRALVEEAAGQKGDKASVRVLMEEIAHYGFPEDKKKAGDNFFQWWELRADQDERIEALKSAIAWITSR
jgi:hypothetical protein